MEARRNSKGNPIPIVVTDEKGEEEEGNVLDRLPSTLRTTIEEIRHPEGKPTYHPLKEKPWHSAMANSGTDFNPNSYCTIKLHLKDLQNLVSCTRFLVTDWHVNHEES